jgi:hypothetical protein
MTAADRTGGWSSDQGTDGVADVDTPTILSFFHKWSVEMNSEQRPTFSPEAKLIVASNIAVADAIWHLIRKDENGTHFQTGTQMAEISITSVLRNFDSLVETCFPNA